MITLIRWKRLRESPDGTIDAHIGEAGASKWHVVDADREGRTACGRRIPSEDNTLWREEWSGPTAEPSVDLCRKCLMRLPPAR